MKVNNLIDSKLYSLLETIANFVLLNLIWLIVSLPIITLFPATAAMYGVMSDWRKKSEPGVFKHFFKQFIRHFKQSFLLGILFFLFVLIFAIDLAVMDEVGSNMSVLIFSLLLLIAILVTFICIYIFPLMTSYQLSIKNLIKNGFLFSIMYFLTTLLSIFVLGVAFLIAVLVPVTLLFIFSPTAYLHLILCQRTFDKVDSIIKKKKSQSLPSTF